MASSVGLPAMFAHMPPPVLFPAITEHKSTVIIAHGLGDSGNGYAPIVESWHSNGFFQDTKFILPSAPSMPVTSAGGRSIPAWFDIRGERGPHVTFDDLTAQPQDEEGLLRSRDYLLSLIRSETAEEGETGQEGVPPAANPSSSSSSSSSSSPPIPASQVILGGFSQGGVLSLLAGLPGDGLGIGGVFCLSGYMPLAGAVRAADEKVFLPSLGAGLDAVEENGKGKEEGTRGVGGGSMEVLMVHGDRDPVMNQEWAEKSAGIVRDLGYHVDLRIVRGLGHSINQEVLAALTAFISKVQEKGRQNHHDEL